MIHHYILDGHTAVPCDDIMEWMQWYEYADKTIRFTEFEDGTFVSTVFLGLDHNFGLGPPLLFETMIGRGNRETGAGSYEPHQWRYTTWDQAEAGHTAAVKMVSLRIQYTKTSATND